MRTLALVVTGLAALVAGCVDTSFPEGLPCAAPDRSCPPQQRCFDVQGGARCYSQSPPDAGTVGACDPVAQSCGAGLACYWRPAEMGGSFCAQPGTSVAHTPCSADIQCQAGTGCLMTALLGRECAPFCRVGGATTCMGLDSCVAIDLTVGTCQFSGCDVLQQNCGPSEACYLDTARHVGMCTRNPGTGAQGTASCTMFSCAKGLHCLSCGAGGERCGRYCDRRHGDGDCAGLGTTCVPLEGDDIGICNPC